MELLDTTVAVQTPERVRFRHRLAGPALRGVAWAVDLVAQVAIGLMLLVAVPVLGEGVGVGLFFVGMFLLSWFYAAVWELAMRGQTPGKRLLGLRVVAHDGRPASRGALVLRNLLRAADALPFLYVVGVLVMFGDRRMRRLGDIAAGTLVIVEGAAAPVEASGLTPPLRAEEVAAVPSSLTLSRAERRAVALLLRRAQRLGSDLSEELARPLARRVRDRHGITGRAAWGRSDVRLLAAALARVTGVEPDAGGEGR